MTTKANKFGLRAAAKERSAKHAQRTLLPPRPGQVQDARDAIAEATGAMGPALRKLMERSDRDGTFPSEKKIEKAYAKDQAARAPRANEEPATAPEGIGGKPGEFIAAAAGSGWAVDVKEKGRTLTVTATRGDEAVSCAWEGGVFAGPCLYSRADGGAPVKLRNASAGRQQMAQPAPTEAQLTARRSAIAKKTTGSAVRVPVRQMGFNPDLLTDEELAARLTGCSLVWINSISGLEESDIVPPRTKVRVDEGASGRQAHFNSPLGARTVRVSSIIHIEGGQIMKRRAKAS